MSLKERTQGHTQIIDMWPQKGIVYISNPKKNTNSSGRTFVFDSVYDWNANQDDLYKRTVQPLVYSVLEGFNGTIFAYGQTGTGKTYTMLGSRGNPKEKGIIAKCFEEIFTHISYNNKHTSFVVRASYFEIYQEETRDLLSQDIKKKPLREDVVRGVYVKGLQSVVCKNLKAIEKVMRIGNMNRATAATNMNEHSSRSHAIFQITVEMQDREAKESGRLRGFRVGKLNLVDLAGSERQCKTGAVGERLKESGKINLSLSALGNVISSLVKGKSAHIPYRDSKLTQLLQDSLGGNSKSIMIANIGPASYNYDESLMTLRYASRAKHVRNHPVRNVDNMSSVFWRFREEVRALEQLMDREQVDSSSSNISRTLTSSSLTDRSHGRVSPSSHEGTPTRTERGAGDAGRHCRILKSRNKSRADEIRRRRTQKRLVWRLRGKYHQETTVKMVKWLQEQMAQSPEDNSKGGEATDALQASNATKIHKPTRDGFAPTKKHHQTSFIETERTTQKLIDELSYLVKRESMLTSIAQLSEENRRRRKQVNILLDITLFRRIKSS